jgi:hypothetical protein
MKIEYGENRKHCQAVRSFCRQCAPYGENESQKKKKDLAVFPEKSVIYMLLPS